MKYRSKKGQLPFVEINGEEIADSTIIIKELSQKFGHDLDAGLAEQRNIAHASISMVENHLAWVVMWWRTKYPELVLKGYKVNLQHALGTRIPNGILNFFFKFAFGRKVRTHRERPVRRFGSLFWNGSFLGLEGAARWNTGESFQQNIYIKQTSICTASGPTLTCTFCQFDRVPPPLRPTLSHLSCLIERRDGFFVREKYARFRFQMSVCTVLFLTNIKYA
jgi:hypothetical protein